MDRPVVCSYRLAAILRDPRVVRSHRQVAEGGVPDPSVTVVAELAVLLDELGRPGDPGAGGLSRCIEIGHLAGVGQAQRTIVGRQLGVAANEAAQPP